MSEIISKMCDFSERSSRLMSENFKESLKEMLIVCFYFVYATMNKREGRTSLEEYDFNKFPFGLTIY